MVAESEGDSPDECATEEEDADARFPPLLTRRRIEPRAVCAPVEVESEEEEDAEDATAVVTIGGGVMLMLGMVLALAATGISAADVCGAVDTNAGFDALALLPLVLPLELPLVLALPLILLPLPLFAENPKLPPGTKAGALADSRTVLLRAGVSDTLASGTDLVVDDSSANAVRPKSPAGFLDGLDDESAAEAADAGLAPLRGVVTKPRCWMGAADDADDADAAVGEAATLKPRCCRTGVTETETETVGNCVCW